MLFVGRRDVSLMRHINREVIHDLSDIQVDVYKISAEHTNANIYGESDVKVYHLPIRLHCLINRDAEQYVSDEIDTFEQSIEFYFLRDDLLESEYVVEVSDIVHYNNEYYEIDQVQENQFASGKNPVSAFSGGSHGWNVSIVALGHIVPKNFVTIEEVRGGHTPSRGSLPENL